MPQATYQFPTGFMWGSATASHQVEGSNTNNNWFAWENTEGKIKNGHRSGLACDWWGGRWKEDFNRAAETGQNAHRLSVEWSRIQPAPDRWDEHALDYYREWLQYLVQLGMTPMVTLHHFSNPLWLEEKGGWENPDAPKLFDKFVEKTVEALKEYCSLWVTINEPNVYTNGAYMGGGFPPNKTDNKAAFTVMLNLLRGHGLAYRTIHRIQPQARVGIAQHIRGFRPANPSNPMDKMAANLLDNNFNKSFVNAVEKGTLKFLFQKAFVPEAIQTQDFVGLNYYTVDMVKFSPSASKDFFNQRFFPPDAAVSETGFIANVPGGLYDYLKWGAGFGKPIIISENGIEDSRDTLRSRYLIEHLHQVWRAINFNWQIKGYFHWSLVDNFEWERGWTQRFGLWGLDVETQARIRRPSVDVYATICKENAISYDLVQKYSPDSIPSLFPG